VKALSLFQRCLCNYYYNVPFALSIREVHPQPHTSFVITNARSAQTDPQGKPTLVTTIKPTKAQHYAAPLTACPPAFGSCKMLKAQANIPPLSSLHTSEPLIGIFVVIGAAILSASRPFALVHRSTFPASSPRKTRW
jgi:hypothetical protein